MKTYKMVCVGGVADGRAFQIPEGQYTWEVAVPHRLEVVHDKNEPPTFSEQRHRYYVETIRVANTSFSLLRHADITVEQMVQILIDSYDVDFGDSAPLPAPTQTDPGLWSRSAVRLAQRMAVRHYILSLGQDKN